ncbi:B12-binding domain-containing radical SAM protein [bacterium]|nr:B12-binding domain-containing radical SAM protein [bacterium]
MKVLLVEPRTPETFWSLRHALRFVGKRAANPPLGLLTMAGLLPRDWDLRVTDLNTGGLTDAEILWADYVMVSGMVIHRDGVVDLGDRCRELGRPLIGGGPLFSDEARGDLGVDHVVVGEAEETVGELVADMLAGRVKSLYTASRFPDLSLTPSPRWDLLEMRHYATMSVQSCRGCPFDCEFCDVVALNGRKPRYKSPEQFVGELEDLRARGWRGPVFIVDDNFIGDRNRCLELLRAVIAWRRRTHPPMVFLTEASVNMGADAELLELMVEAGFKKVFLGIETPSAESLHECHKLQNLRGDLGDAVLAIQNAGIEVMGGFIVGFDSDEPDIFQRQFDFIQKSGVVTAMVGLLQALPSSRLYRRLAAEGRLLGASLGDNTKAALNFEPRLDREFLVENYRRLMQRLYEPGNYYRRVRTFLDAHPMRGPNSPLSRADLGAVVKAMWLMGVIHKGRLAYWRFLTSTLVRHPGQIGVAITMAITGHHFRIMAEGL